MYLSAAIGFFLNFHIWQISFLQDSFSTLRRWRIVQCFSFLFCSVSMSTLKAIRANKAITHASHKKKLQAGSKVYCGKWRNLYLANDRLYFLHPSIPTQSNPLNTPVF